jgi:hypothetical protein
MLTEYINVLAILFKYSQLVQLKKNKKTRKTNTNKQDTKSGQFTSFG